MAASIPNPEARIGDTLRGRRGLVVGIAEVGGVVAFLVGRAASGRTGDTIHAAGGLHHVA